LILLFSGSSKVSSISQIPTGSVAIINSDFHDYCHLVVPIKKEELNEKFSMLFYG
jgi:hypothetical protein